MGDSDDTSRRGLLALLAIMGAGAVRFGDGLVRILGDMPAMFYGILARGSREIDDSKGEPTPERTQSEIDYEPYELRNRDGEVEVEPNSYHFWEFDFTSDAGEFSKPLFQYDVLVREGPNVDIFVLEAEEFRAFENGDNFYGHSLSEYDVFSASNSGVLDFQKYYFVVDHTTAGPTTPDQNRPVRVDVEITVEESA